MDKTNWNFLKRFEGPTDKVGRTPAVDVTYKELRSGLIFSYSAVLIQKDGSDRPTMFLRGDMITDYIELFREAAQLAQKLNTRWDSENGRERLTASMFEHFEHSTKRS